MTTPRAIRHALSGLSHPCHHRTPPTALVWARHPCQARPDLPTLPHTHPRRPRPTSPRTTTQCRANLPVTTYPPTPSQPEPRRHRPPSPRPPRSPLPDKAGHPRPALAVATPTSRRHSPRRALPGHGRPHRTSADFSVPPMPEPALPSPPRFDFPSLPMAHRPHPAPTKRTWPCHSVSTPTSLAAP